MTSRNIVLIAFLLLSAGCAPIRVTPPAVQATPTTGLLPTPFGTATMTPQAATSATPGGTASPVQPGTAATGTPFADGQGQAAVGAALRDLASRLGVTQGAIAVVSVEAVNWPDTSLGAPQPGMVYAQVITPGYRVILRSGERTYEVHTDSTGRQVVVRDPSSSVDSGPKPSLSGILAYLNTTHPEWALGSAAQWLLEDVAVPNPAGASWTWHRGEWSLTVWSTVYGQPRRVQLSHDQLGLRWEGTLGADGAVTPGTLPNASLSDPEAARAYLLQQLAKSHPGLGLDQRTAWIASDVPAGGLLGYARRTWHSGEWSIQLGYPVVERPNYDVTISHKRAGVIWRGTCSSTGEPVQDKPVALTFQSGPCDESIAPEALTAWAAVTISARGDAITVEQNLSYVCCAQLSAFAGRDGAVVKIIETNTGGVCRCMCGYQIDATLLGLGPGTYTIQVWGVQHGDAHSLELLGEERATLTG